MLVVSPHLDDGVLSVGGTIARLSAAGSAVVVATLFTGSPPAPLSVGARAFHEQCGLGDDAMRHRAEEDEAACDAVGAEHRHLDLPEALYRIDADGRHLYRDGRDIFGPDPLAEPGVISAVEKELRRLLDWLRPDAVVAPLGVGDHVDHAITKVAVRRCNIDPARLRWSEDVPYALYPHLRGWEARLTRELVSETELLGESEWMGKIAAVSCYASQLGILWHDPAPWHQQLLDYADRIGDGRTAERLWRQPQLQSSTGFAARSSDRRLQ